MITVSALNPLKFFKKRKGSRSLPCTPSEPLPELESARKTAPSLIPRQQAEKHSPADQKTKSDISSRNSLTIQRNQSTTTASQPDAQWQLEAEQQAEHDEVDDEDVYSAYPDHTIPVVVDSVEGFPRITTDVRRSSSIRTSVSSAAGKGRYRQSPASSMEIKQQGRASSGDSDGSATGKGKGKEVDGGRLIESHRPARSGVPFLDVDERQFDPRHGRPRRERDEQSVSPRSRG